MIISKGYIVDRMTLKDTGDRTFPLCHAMEAYGDGTQNRNLSKGQLLGPQNISSKVCKL